MEYNHWRVNARLVRTLINRSAETIDWLQTLGVEFLEQGHRAELLILKLQLVT